MIFPAADESAEVMEPGKEAFDLPTAAVTPQFAEPGELHYLRGAFSIPVYPRFEVPFCSGYLR